MYIYICIYLCDIKKLKLYGPFSWMGFNCLKAIAISRRQFTFYHSVPRISWCLFYRPRKDERLGRPWRYPVVLNTGPLDWESSTLTARPLLWLLHTCILLWSFMIFFWSELYCWAIKEWNRCCIRIDRVCIYIYIYIFASIFTKCKMSHQSILLPRNGKNLNDLTFFQMEKKWNSETEKLENLFISTKWKKIGSTFLCFSMYLTSFPHITSLPFITTKCKLNNFLYFCIRISFHFREVDNASPKWFISMK